MEGTLLVIDDIPITAHKWHPKKHVSSIAVVVYNPRPVCCGAYGKDVMNTKIVIDLLPDISFFAVLYG